MEAQESTNNKHRGKCVLTNNWVHGRLELVWDEKSRMGDWLRKGLPTYIIINIIPFAVEGETLGRYTGMKDIEGREIYEDDIVEVLLGNCGEVFEGCITSSLDQWYVYMPAFKEWEDLSTFSEINVIGNIHDNEF